MRNFIIILLVCTIFGCKETQDQNQQNLDEKEPWFFWSVDWHPTEDMIAVGGSNDTFLKILSTCDYKDIKHLPYNGTITKTKWHPSENKLAFSVQDGKSKSAIFDLEATTLIQLDSITNAGARGLGWNYTGELLAVGDNSGHLVIFDDNGKFLKIIDTGEKGLMGLDWHPKENLLVAVGDNVIIYNYELDSLKIIKDRTEEIEVLMLCVAWHPSGGFFVTGDYGDFQNNYPPLLQYWTYNGQKMKSIEKSKAEYRNLRWSPNGLILATASEKIRLWDQYGAILAEGEASDLLWGIDWNANGIRLVTTDDQGKIIFSDSNLNKVKELEY